MPIYTNLQNFLDLNDVKLSSTSINSKVNIKSSHINYLLSITLWACEMANHNINFKFAILKGFPILRLIISKTHLFPKF